MPKNKVKLNDKLNKKKKTKSIKPEKYISEETKEVRRFVIILIGIIIVVLIVYGVSKIFIKDDEENTNNVTAGEINYDIVSIGTMFNRKPSEYYVIIYDQESTDAVIYSAIISKYVDLGNAIPIYFCDLGNKLNNDYYVGEDGVSNPKAKTIEELALKELTLVKIKNGTIIKYIEDIDTIKTELGI